MGGVVDLTFPRSPGFHSWRSPSRDRSVRCANLSPTRERHCQTLAPPAGPASDCEADQSSDDNKEDDHKKDEFADACQETSGFEFGGEQAGLRQCEQHSSMVGPQAPPRCAELSVSGHIVAL